MSGDWNGTVNPYCNSCIYYGKSTCTCDYILIVGHPRPCPAGAGCTARILKKDVKKKMGKPRWDIAQGKQMWEQGMSDSQIAKHFGIAANTVLHQRRSYWEKGVTAPVKKKKEEAEVKTLRDVKIGETVSVVKLHGEGAVKRRIMDMGITKGVEVFVRKVAPLGDPIEVNVRGYELSLRKEDAQMIEVS